MSNLTRFETRQTLIQLIESVNRGLKMKKVGWFFLNAMALATGLFSSALQAAETKTYRVEGRVAHFIEVKMKADTSILLNQDCVKSDGKPKCEAYQAALKASYKGVEGPASANPGALICIHQKDARYVIGTDAKRNENGFCKFPDGSLISGGSLYGQAILNDGK
jgi:hypothetical protein